MTTRRCDFQWQDDEYNDWHKCPALTYRNSKYCKQHLEQKKQEQKALEKYTYIRKQRERIEALGQWAEQRIEALKLQYLSIRELDKKFPKPKETKK